MADCFEAVIDRFVLASAGFGRRLRGVRPGQWAWPTPCTGWDVWQLVNHMTQGNLNYVRLLHGGTSAQFLCMRNADALGADPVAAYTRSVHDCARAFAAPGALQQVLDYPLGQISGQQALAVRTADSTIHTWDLARAVGADESLDASLVTWISYHLYEIYAGLAETPVSPATSHQFFAAPVPVPPRSGQQEQLLCHMGRNPSDSP